MTSSAINNAFLVSKKSFNSFKKLFCGITTPILPPTGSMITAAISSCFSKCAFTLSKLLYSAISVFFTAPSGTPLEPGKLKVAKPEPAATNNAS